jgi:hypothetical protein
MLQKPNPFEKISKPKQTREMLPGAQVADVSQKLASTAPEDWEVQDVHDFLVKTIPVGCVSGIGAKDRVGAHMYEAVMAKMDVYIAKYPYVGHLLDPYYLIVYPVTAPVLAAMAAYPNLPEAHHGQNHIYRFGGIGF